jgi:hypothetical protein
MGAMSVLAIIASALPAQADLIPVTYSLTGVGIVQSATDTTLTLTAQASGSVLSGDPGFNAAWNPVTYSDEAVLDLNTGLLNGSFTFTFADGQTLTGSVFEDNTAILASPTQTGPFTQTLTFTGGTGEFAGATGSLSGQGFVGATGFTVSGSGTIRTAAVPEPSSILLLLSGFTLIMAGARRSAAKCASLS